MICKFCGNDKKLIEAHIIPAGFFRRLGKGLKLITNRAGEYETKTPVGVYDKTIVCGDCENIWRTWDEYTQLLLAERPLNAQVRYHNGEKIAYIIKGFDYDKLKLFFISMLWRASVSTQHFFSKVALGPFELVAKERISNADPGGMEDFSIILAKFDHPIAKGMLDPHDELWSGVRHYRFYMASYVAYIKVDQKPCPRPFLDFAICRGKPLVILCRNLERSKELPLIKDLLSS